MYDALANPTDPVIGKGYTPGAFKYRSGPLDPKFPTIGNSEMAAILAPYRSGVSDTQAALYRDTLFFAVSTDSSSVHF